MYRIIFGVRVALNVQVGLSGTYTSRSRAFKAGEACWKTNPNIICGFVIQRIPEQREEKARLKLVAKLMKLYPLAYPTVTRRPLWSGELFDALWECPMDYLADMLETLEVSA